MTPIDTSKELSFVINAYDTKVKSLSYEIRTSDGSKVLENRKIKSLDKQDSYLTTTIKLSSDLLMNQEYSLQLSLETNKGTAYYYTRVVSRSNVNAAQYVKFVASFYEKCLDKASAEDLTAYLESDTSSTSTNYTALDEDGNQEIYDVTEFYRMRYTETRIMLLDFKRSASQVFEESSISISDKGLLLGVRDKNVEYMMNENGWRFQGFQIPA